MVTLRPCRNEDRPCLLAIINAAAQAYRGVIPEDCWHEPYMTAAALDQELAAGVDFWGHEAEGALVGVMGRQLRGDVELIRHAYVRPAWQQRGVGSALLAQLLRTRREVLVGTWKAATWAIRFYERHGFGLVEAPRTAALLRRYWNITPRQRESSVVLRRAPPNG
ncbi:MAG: GNAT family N-acetyltransferase [Gammaproteobacteria bacterium]|nr:GNAT family N-acetyltransferase [Gammaproteobacteria bacterium]MBV9621499.1 GNAT family N-acetyltransferase [Gammaproteobacteria bacterium]